MMSARELERVLQEGSEEEVKEAFKKYNESTLMSR